MTRGQRPGRPPENRPLPESADSPAATTDALIVRQRRPRKRHYPLASASLYAPANARTWWWISLRCPWCKAVHLHRVRSEQDAGGVRRTGCGRLVFVKIRSVYRGAVPASAGGRRKA
jgi:hypothetical protein